MTMSGVIKLNCPQCRRLLKVPLRAAGQKTKCPACASIFPVPEPTADGEGHTDDSIANWILDDVDKTLLRRDKDVEDRVRPDPHQVRERLLEERKKVTANKLHEVAGGEHGAESQPEKAAGVSVGKKKPLPPPDEYLVKKAQAAASKKAVDPDAQALAEAQHAAAVAPSRPAETGQSAKPSDAIARAQADPGAIVPAVSLTGAIPVRNVNAVTGRSDERYPQNLHINAPIPHLVISKVSPHGIVLAFDCIWLDHMKFRTSMPMRCSFTGNSDRSDMYARPLVFCDRSNAQVRSAGDVSQGHGQRIFEDMKPAEVVQVLGYIEKMPPPFDKPMPYYVSPMATEQYLECTTQKRPDEGVTCFVRMPDPRYALDWVARVNGQVDPEYELLEEDVRRLQADPWARQPMEIRRNLESWVELQPHERFVRYFNEAEFTAKDSGLAGFVITDKRLLWRKYARKGEFDLTQPGELRMTPDADFAAIWMVEGGHKHKLCLLRLTDIHAMREALNHAPAIKVEIVEGS